MSGALAITIATKTLRLALVTLTRPNNAIAYGAGQVWGAAADARVSVVVPARPSDATTSFCTLGAWQGWWGRNAADALSGLAVYAFTAAPTVLGDQAALAFTDADLAVLLVNNAGNASIATFSAGAAALNTGAAGAGKRIASMSPTTLAGVAWGATVWFYLVSGAYNPVANEQIAFTPTVQYTSRIEP